MLWDLQSTVFKLVDIDVSLCQQYVIVKSTFNELLRKTFELNLQSKNDNQAYIRSVSNNNTDLLLEFLVRDQCTT